MTEEQRQAACGCNDTTTPLCAVCRLFGLTAPEPVLSCRFRGESVRVHGSARDWRACGHPDQPLGPSVCQCMGCGPKCSGYEATT